MKQRRKREQIKASVASQFVVYERVRESFVAGSPSSREAGEAATAGPQGPM